MAEAGFISGTLWQRVLETTANAIESGAIQTIPTKHAFIEQDGVEFVVRIVSSLASKDAAREAQRRGAAGSERQANPFLPYENALFVADVSHTHVCLLNKFNVVDHHLLIVTRAFKNQESPLNISDFEALWACMLEFEGLGFYNGGEVAGASQPHRHLQMVPLPLAPRGPRIPIEHLLVAPKCEARIGTISALPFLHAFVWLDSMASNAATDAAETSLRYYRGMLNALGLINNARSQTSQRTGPYNLLITREWMLLVPRSTELFEGISVNALGFAGALLARDNQQLDTLKALGPMTALQHVSFPSKTVNP